MRTPPYLTTVDGRLRIDLAWANLREHLPLVGADDDRPRAVERALSAESVIEPLYGEPARLFDRTSLAERLSRAGVSIVAERGVRVLSDYLPASAAATPAGYDRVLAFEHTLGATPELVDMARYIQVLAVPTASR